MKCHTSMLLYNVPRNHRVKVIQPELPPPGGEPIIENQEYNFHHLDGMYSYCTDDDGRVIHLRAWTEVIALGPLKQEK